MYLLGGTVTDWLYIPPWGIRRVAVAGILLVALGVLLAWPLAAMGESPMPAERALAPSLEISLKADKEKFQVGELVVVQVVMRNTAKNPVTLQLPLTTLNGNLHGQPFQFAFRTAVGGAVPLPGTFVDAMGGSLRQQVLEPDGTAVLEYDLFTVLGNAIAPGNYVVEARYEDKKAGIQAASKALAVTVDGGTADDARALSLYQDVVRAGERSLTIELAQRLLKEYPRSPVADRAKEVLAHELYMVGRKPEAEVLWRELVAVRPTWRDEVRFRLATYLHDQGKVKEAIEVMEPVQTDYAQGLVKEWKQKISATGPATAPAKQSGTPAGSGSPSGM
jgi:hypothetical protein